MIDLRIGQVGHGLGQRVVGAPCNRNGTIRRCRFGVAEFCNLNFRLCNLNVEEQ